MKEKLTVGRRRVYTLQSNRVSLIGADQMSRDLKGKLWRNSKNLQGREKGKAGDEETDRQEIQERQGKGRCMRE